MSQFREIITKAVVAKGRKFKKSNHTICPAHHPSSILGCWIINHKYDAKKVGKKVEIQGTYDINIWYSYNKNTKTEVVTEKIRYTDGIRLKYRDPDCHDDDEVIARVVQQPNCIEATISQDGQKIVVEAEREFFVEVIGETKVIVSITNDEFSDDDNWELDVDDDEFDDINTDFIEEKEAK